MPCWTDYIGIRAECGGDTTPPSGLWMDDIPGVTLSIADRLAFGQDRVNNGLELMQKIRDTAINEVKAKAGAVTSRMMRLNKLVQVDNAGEWRYSADASEDFLAASADYAGVRLCLDQRDYRAFSRIYVTTVQVYTNTTLQNQPLWFGVRGTNVTTKNVNLAAGQVIDIDVYEEFDTDDLLIYWILVPQVNDSRLSWTNCKGCGNRFKGWARYGPHVKVQGWRNTAANVNGATFHDQTFGISVNFEVRCSRDEMLCALRPELKYIIWKETALRFYNEVLSSDSFTDVPNLRQESYRQMRDELLLELNGNPENSNVKGLWHDFAEGSRRALSQYTGKCVECRSPRAANMLL